MQNKNFKKVGLKELDKLVKDLKSIYTSIDLKTDEKISFSLNGDKKRIKKLII